MINDIILLKQGEIVLKGLNRRSFEQKLMSNIKRRLAAIGKFKVYCMQSTVYIEPVDETSDMDAAFEAMTKVFGLASVNRAAGCEKDAKRIAELAIEYLRDDMLAAKSFKAEAKRGDKSFPMTSIELAQFVGGELAEAYPDCEVDVHDPELTVYIEVRDLAAYVHAAPTPGAGGMPVGANGTAVTLLSGGIDSPVSSYMIAKRGVHLIPVHFFSFPYTSEQAKQKVIELARLLTDYCGRMTIEVVPFTHIQEEIVRLARKIGTFETSILPYEDCCTVFTPKHPKTKPKLRDVEQIESALDIDALVEEAYAGIERIKVGD